MTPRQKQALELHEKGLSYAAIGAEMRVTRQTALEHVRKAQYFTAQAPSGKPSDFEEGPSLFDPVNAMGGEDVPSTVPIRGAADTAMQGGWTPSTLVSTITRAIKDMDTSRLFSLYREMERKDANYRSVKETRINQVCQLPDVLTPITSRKRDKTVSDWCQQFVKSDAFQDAKTGLMEGIFDGAAAGENFWGVDADGITLVDFKPIEGRHFVFSKADGRTLFLAPVTHGGKPVPLDGPRASILYAKKGGVAVGGGLALVGLWSFVAKWLALKDWASLSAVYGKPAKVGKYKSGTDPAQIRALRNAISSLGSDAAALIPDTMVIEFATAATVAGSADMFERFVRYMDEQVAKLLLGASLTTGTSNTGTGGSQALGNVHNELRYDIMRADAKTLARSLRLCILTPAVEQQFGAGTPIPLYELQVDEPEDLVALAEVAEAGQRMGLSLSKKALAKRLGLTLAAEDEPDDVLAPVAVATPAPAAEPADPAGFTATAPASITAPLQSTLSHAHAHSNTCPVHGTAFTAAGTPATPARDSVDNLVDETLDESDWETITLAIDAAIQEVVSQSTGLDDLRAKLGAFVESGDVEELRLFLTAQKSKAHLAAAEGADLTAASGAND